MKPNITAAMIVRDECAVLKGCLDSLEKHVDEIIIVDTGSTDDSRNIARAGGARLLEFSWCDDFAAARNMGLAACRTDWVLYIDADERLIVSDGAKLAETFEPGWTGAWVTFKPKSGFTRYIDPRLHRRDERLRFTGRIHETLYPAMLSLSANGGGSIGMSGASIDHLGYDGDQAAKHLRNLPLLQMAVLECPERVYLWYHLAETLDAVGRHEEAAVAASTGIRAAQSAADEKTRQDASLIYQFQARSMLRRGEDPLNVLKEGLERVPQDYALTFLLAHRHVASGNPEAALALADALLAVDPERLPLCFLAFDKQIFREGARRIKARALIDLGRAQEAVDVLNGL
jgi:glycosyltransferase involved in cell wall biosynthesis